jgi:hypothetical protein
MSIGVTFARSPLARTLATLVVGSVLVVFWKWDSLSSHARGLILGAYGITFLGSLLIPALRTRRLLKSGVTAQGTVVGAEENTSTDADGITSTSYNPVVHFTTVDGRMVEFTSAVGWGNEPDVGGAVNVRYLSNDPEQAEIDRATMWIVPAAFGLLGGLGLLVAGALVYAGGDDDAGSVAQTTASTGVTTPVETSSTTTVPADTPVLGSWHRAQTCQEMLLAFEEAGLAEAHREWIQGNFFGGEPGPATGDACAGAVGPLEHDHFFTAAGEFGSHDENGEEVDGGDFAFVDDHTLAFPSHATEFRYEGDVLVDYSINGDIVTFEVQMPDACAEACADAYAWALSAFATGPWQRGEVP